MRLVVFGMLVAPAEVSGVFTDRAGLKAVDDVATVEVTHGFHPSARVCASGRCAHPTLWKSADDAWAPHLVPRPFARCCSCSTHANCTNSRGEEDVLVALLGATRLPPSPTYFEVGGLDGIHASNTLFLQQCLGWRGVLMEGNPRSFEALVGNRPGVVAIGCAACTSTRTVQFRGNSPATTRMVRQGRSGQGGDVACGPVQSYFDLVGASHFSVMSIDVEGAELETVRSIDWRRTSAAIIVVEENVKRDMAKNLQVRHVLTSEANATMVHTTCWIHGVICDSFFVNPRWTDLLQARRIVRDLPSHDAQFHRRRDRQIKSNNLRCAATPMNNKPARHEHQAGGA